MYSHLYTYMQVHPYEYVKIAIQTYAHPTYTTHNQRKGGKERHLDCGGGQEFCLLKCLSHSSAFLLDIYDQETPGTAL